MVDSKMDEFLVVTTTGYRATEATRGNITMKWSEFQRKFRKMKASLIAEGKLVQHEEELESFKKAHTAGREEVGDQQVAIGAIFIPPTRKRTRRIVTKQEEANDIE